MADEKNRYVQILEKIFVERYQEGKVEITFERTDFVDTARELGIELPKNLGDVVYSFRYRANLPRVILERAPSGFQWIITDRCIVR